MDKKRENWRKLEVFGGFWRKSMDLQGREGGKWREITRQDRKMSSKIKKMSVNGEKMEKKGRKKEEKGAQNTGKRGKMEFKKKTNEEKTQVRTAQREKKMIQKRQKSTKSWKMEKILKKGHFYEEIGENLLKCFGKVWKSMILVRFWKPLKYW